MGEEDQQEVLKELSARAILEFEDVRIKYKEYFEKCTKEEAKRKRIEAQFKQLKQVSLLAVAEYESLHKQYVTENKYRLEVEEKVKKLTEENKTIRKQNKLGDNTMIIPSGNADQGTKGELEVLRTMKDAVNNELRNTKNELSRTKEMLQQEKAAHAITKKRLAIGTQQMKQLNRVSVLALDEFTDLKKKFETEANCRRKAEDVATELVGKQELTDRKTKIIEEQTSKDEQLKTLMAEMDEINRIAQEERKKNAEKIKELEEELKNSENTDALKSMEDKLSLMMDQLDIAQKQLTECEARCEKAESDSRNLYTRLAMAEREADSSRLATLPPPPPPPPPPIAAPVIRKFISRIGKKKKSSAEIGKDEDDPVASAMADMVERIKKGVKLRSVASPVKSGEEGETDEPGGKMGELAGLLSNLRRNKVGTEASLDVVDEEPPEFARFKLKKTNTIKSASSVDAEDVGSTELKKKLARQKSVADGIEEESTSTSPPKTAQKPKKPSKSEGVSDELEKSEGQPENLKKILNEETSKQDNMDQQSLPKEESGAQPDAPKEVDGGQEKVSKEEDSKKQTEESDKVETTEQQGGENEDLSTGAVYEAPPNNSPKIEGENYTDMTRPVPARRQTHSTGEDYIDMTRPVPARRQTTSTDGSKGKSGEDLYELIGASSPPSSPTS
ncbi:shootin-1-like isoform X2 [Hydractinia symbiolongicarpus]|uniref:shootin-1-like isoform X2 n=1 Tax=Hydractinia symbiolongicarpus TaxID=13093 RepID=UPI00254FD1C2|nr:shootin-1-like isoform X2 [Hydractinia symbiolongicarpus]